MASRTSATVEIALFLFLSFAWLSFATATSRLGKIQPPLIAAEMQVSLPRFIQVTLSGGDRFLATNVSVFRALVVSSGNKDPDRFAVQSVIQSDAAWFNPRNEDNYYLATAILPWNQHVEPTQHILKQASDSRPFDMLPPFYLAFNEYYFRHDPIAGATWLKIAAIHSDSTQDSINLEKIAARWAEKGSDRHEALKLLEGMAAQSHYPSIRAQLLQRAKRVKNLIGLDEAIKVYKQTFHKTPDSLGELVSSGILKELPQDPLGLSYTLDSQGTAQIISSEKK